MRSNTIVAVSAAALTIGGYGAWILLQGIEAQHWQSILFGTVALITAVAMFARQTWSRFLVYALVAYFCSTWGYVIIGAIRNDVWAGYDGFGIFLFLLPGLATAAAALACAFVAARFLRPLAP